MQSNELKILTLPNVVDVEGNSEVAEEISVYSVNQDTTYFIEEASKDAVIRKRGRVVTIDPSETQ